MPQEFENEQQVSPSPYRFWLLWFALSLPTITVGIWLSFLTIGYIGNTLIRTIIFALIGAGVGAIQTIPLGGRIKELFWWVLVTAGGWSLGFSFADRWGVYAGLAIGLSLGFLQWLALSMSLRKSLVWIPAMLIAWGLGWFIGWQVELTGGLANYVVYLLVTAFLPAATGGAAIAWMLREDRDTELGEAPSEEA